MILRADARREWHVLNLGAGVQSTELYRRFMNSQDGLPPLDAVEVDRALREPGRIIQRSLRQPIYLHRSGVSLDQVILQPRANNQLSLSFVAECEGVCGV